MKIKWPVDFEGKVRMPAALGGNGYPFRISAKDLMQNFQAAADVVPDGEEIGQMLYWNGERWATVSPGYEDDMVLKSDGAEPYWETIANGTGINADITIMQYNENSYYYGVNQNSDLILYVRNGLLVHIAPTMGTFAGETPPGTISLTLSSMVGYG